MGEVEDLKSVERTERAVVGVVAVVGVAEGGNAIVVSPPPLWYRVVKGIAAAATLPSQPSGLRCCGVSIGLGLEGG